MAPTPSPAFLSAMPKVELHVHIEGSIRPATVLKLAERHGETLPADTVEGLSEWYDFRDFEHFVEVYIAVSKCVRTPEDIELIVREFLEGQAEQNVLHTEATYTASTIEKLCGIPWDEQIDAVNRAREWAHEEYGVTLGLIIDLVRGHPVERGMEVLGWVKGSLGNGVIAMGRTNDAILYGGRVHLTVRGDDAAARQLALQLPSRNSRDYGRSFADIFKEVEYDFYKIDGALFAPAEVWVSNLDSGNTWHAGALNMALLQGLWLQQA